MKRTFKLSIVLLCILMLFASCAGSPETKIPGDNVMDQINGTPNGDGTVTLPGGVVADSNGFIAGEVAEGGIKNPNGTVIKPTKLKNDEYLMLYKIKKFAGSANGIAAYEAKLKEYEEGESYTITLTEPHTFKVDEVSFNGNPLTIHALKMVNKESGGSHEVNAVIVFSFSGVGVKHTYQQHASGDGMTGCFVETLDGNPIDWEGAPDDPDSH